MKNYYQLLGVTERATDSEIQVAYTNMYQKCLLDKGSGGNVEEKLIDILVAYNALTNNKIKKEYNKVLQSNVAYDKNLPSQTHNVSISNNWLKANLASVVSITMLVAIFAYTIVLLTGYVRNNKQENVANANTKHFINDKVPAKIPAVEIVKHQETSHYIGVKPVTKQTIALTSTFKATPKHNSSNAKVTMPEQLSKGALLTTSKETLADINSSTVKQGSVKGEVLKVRGTPNAIVRFDNQTEIWCYSDEKISFSNGIATSIQPN